MKFGDDWCCNWDWSDKLEVVLEVDMVDWVAHLVLDLCLYSECCTMLCPTKMTSEGNSLQFGSG